MFAEGAGDGAVHLVADRFGQMLVEGAAEGDVQQLHAAADPQHRHVALQRPPGQRQLEAVTLGPGAGGLGVGLGAVAGGVDVGTAGQHQPVDPVEQEVGVLDRRLVGRQDDAQPAGALDGGHVGPRRQRHLVALPDAPADPLDRRADSDGGSDSPSMFAPKSTRNRTPGCHRVDLGTHRRSKPRKRSQSVTADSKASISTLARFR